RQAINCVAVELVGRLLYYTGVLFLIGFVRQRIGRPRLLIPMYHQIAAAERGEPALLAIQHGVPIHVFRQHLRIFRWFGPLLALDEAFRQLHDPRRQRRSMIALTFDDGYRGVISLAVPALQQQSAKGTIFPVVRTASGGRPLWWD